MGEKLYGYTDKILRVNLSSGAIHTEPTSKYAREWLGQRGIGQKILFDELKPWVTPYEPMNRVIIETGPLTGTLAPAAARYSISTKNPFTGGVGTSNSCGFFGPELKFAGYDHIVIQGRAKKPVYLWIHDEHVEVKDASGLWGRTTWETEDLIRDELGDAEIQIISIGPAGENLVRGACVMSNKNRACGRCGTGGVFGSKNLKAVAVRGTGAVTVADPERFMRAVDDAFSRIFASVGLREGHSKMGTLVAVRPKNKECSMPFKNFQDGYIPDEIMQKIDPEIFTGQYKVKDRAGMACPIYCGKVYRVNEGAYAGLETEGVQCEVVTSYGARLAIDSPAAIIKINALCNQMGMDVDAAATAIAWAFECYQRGIITEADTDGLALHWGDHEVVIKLIEKLVARDGFGNILAEGCKRAADILGRDSEYYAIHMKGQDLYEEVRSPLGWGFGTCVATRGGGHTTGASVVDLRMEFDPEIGKIMKRISGIKEISASSYEDKAKLVFYYEREQELVNSLGLCMTVGTWQEPALLGFPELAELYSAVTGWETSEQELVRAADRIFNLEKAFNSIHANLSRQDDYPPARCLKEPIKSGPKAGFQLSEEKWDQMLDEYYDLHGWDPKTGLQTRNVLDRLDLGDVAKALKEAGKLI